MDDQLMVLVPILPVVVAGLLKRRAATTFGIALASGLLAVWAGRTFGLLSITPHASLSALLGCLGVALTTTLCHVDDPRRAAFDEGAKAATTVNRELEAQITGLQTELAKSARLATVGQLVAGVGHEINNPLAYIITNLEFLSEILGRAADQDVLASLADARDGAERIRQIVRELQVLSRVDENVHKVDLNLIIERSIRMSGTQIRQSARLVQDLGTVPPLSANETRLGQVFLNLLMNAAQAIGEGHIEENEIRVTSYTDERGRAIVEVKDSGPGIGAEVRAQIFQPFFTTKSSGSGTGLGLSICHAIIVGLGGEISVESELGKGTLFRIALPAPAVVRERKKSLPAASSSSRVRVLVVDDEPLICRAVQKSLAADHDVTSETSARQALTRLRSGERFDLVLCDLVMPEMSGMDFYAALKTVAPDLVAQVFFMTGGVFNERTTEFVKSLPNPLLEKPLDSKRLRAIIAQRSAGLQCG